MAVSAITNTGTSAAYGAAASTAATTTDGLGRDAFLQLLVTQLRHQDPMKPKEDGEFLSQLAQFSSLEKLTNIESSINTLGQLVLDARTTTTTTTQSRSGGVL